MQLNFDSAGIKPQGNLEPIPLNTYNVTIVDSGKTDTQANDGSAYLFFDLKIVDGPQAGKVQTDRLNLWNKSDKTVEIAKGQLSAYCHVTGKYKFADTQEMHGIPFKARIGPQVAKDGTVSDKYGDVKGLFHMDGNEPGKSTVAGGSPSGAPPFAQAPTPGFAATPPPAGPPAPPPAAPAPPPAAPAPPPVATFPPAGWVAHPTSAGWFWNQTTNEVLSEADLRAKSAPPVAPGPPAPPAPPPAAAPATPAFGAPATPRHQQRSSTLATVKSRRCITIEGGTLPPSIFLRR